MSKSKWSVLTNIHNVSVATKTVLQTAQETWEQTKSLSSMYEPRFEQLMNIHGGEGIFDKHVEQWELEFGSQLAKYLMTIDNHIKSLKTVTKSLKEIEQSLSKILNKVQLGFANLFDLEPQINANSQLDTKFHHSVRIPNSLSVISSFVMVEEEEVHLCMQEWMSVDKQNPLTQVNLDKQYSQGLLDIRVVAQKRNLMMVDICLVRLFKASIQVLQFEVPLGQTETLTSKHKLTASRPATLPFPSTGVLSTKFMDTDNELICLRQSDTEIAVYSGSVLSSPILEMSIQNKSSSIQRFSMCYRSSSSMEGEDELWMGFLLKHGGVELHSWSPKDTKRKSLKKREMPSLGSLQQQDLREIKLAVLKDKLYLLVVSVTNSQTSESGPCLCVKWMKIDPGVTGSSSICWETSIFKLNITAAQFSAWTQRIEVMWHVADFIKIKLGALGRFSLIPDQTGCLSFDNPQTLEQKSG